MKNYTVIFAEKPSQARAYSSAYKVKEKKKGYIEIYPNETFPDGAIITWGIGHLVTLKMPGEYKEEWQKWNLNNLPIIPQSFKYKPTPSIKEHYALVEEIFKECERKKGTIINSVDIDREGSLIFWNILNMTGVKDVTVKRLWINSLEEDEIRKGFKNLQNTKKDIQMFEEAQARQKADWIVGMNASPLYSLLLQRKGYSGSLSIGRVQSPTVYMIYQRQKEIEEFVSKPFYQIEGEFESSNGSYKGMANVKEDSEDSVKSILEHHHIQENNNGIIKSIQTKEKRTKSPRLHSLSTLQTTANKKWKYSPSEVLKVMQELYEKKLVTYPRTDSNFITESEFNYIVSNIEYYQEIIDVSFTPSTTEPNKRFVDSSKVEEHYAIVPTKTIPSQNSINNLTDKEKNIYYEVIATTLGMFHSDYIYEETTIITEVNTLEFKTTGKTEKYKGWKELFPIKEEKTKEPSLPSLKEREEVIAHVGIKEGKTSPPKPYTEGQLINMMKTAGKYIEDDDDVEILKEIEGIGTEATRSGIIERIKEQKYIEVKKNVVYVTQKGKILCEAIEGTLLSSPSMTAKWEVYLKKIGEGKGTQTHFLENIKKFINHIIKEVPEQIANSPVIELIEEQTEERKIATCPSCKGNIEDKGKFYGCSGYKEGCKITFPKKWSEKTLSQTNIKKLVQDGKTNLIKGFKSKKGKKFDAYLKWDKDQNKLSFEFPKKKQPVK